VGTPAAAAAGARGTCGSPKSSDSGVWNSGVRWRVSGVRVSGVRPRDSGVRATGVRDCIRTSCAGVPGARAGVCGCDCGVRTGLTSDLTFGFDSGVCGAAPLLSMTAGGDGGSASPSASSGDGCSKYAIIASPCMRFLCLLPALRSRSFPSGWGGNACPLAASSRACRARASCSALAAASPRAATPRSVSGYTVPITLDASRTCRKRRGPTCVGDEVRRRNGCGASIASSVLFVSG
jgi:hypothetical protein